MQKRWKSEFVLSETSEVFAQIKSKVVQNGDDSFIRIRGQLSLGKNQICAFRLKKHTEYTRIAESKLEET